MPVLNWIGKEAVAKHDKEVPFRLLKKVKSASVGENSQNLIIHGDNLEALKALMPFYYNKVKYVYIDPPYNTGNESWVYNDRVNSPKIRQWLGQVVGRESEDLTRHDKWLCMMYPRLKLLHDLLSDEGIIFISIDDNEAHNLRQIMDEIFEEKNFIAQMTWRQMHTVRNSSKDFNKNTEYIFAYAKNKNLLIVPGDSKTYLRYPSDKSDSYPYDDNDGNGPYKLDPLHSRNFYTPYQFTFNNSYQWSAPKGTYPRYSQENLKRMDEEKIIVFNGTILRKKDGSETAFRGNTPVAKRYLKDVQEGVPPDTLLHPEIVGFSKDGSAEAMAIFGDKVFDQPKPPALIKFLLSIKRSIDDNDYIVLDSFAGSGTTGQAVMDLNKEDGGNRKFILVELEENVVKNITTERIKRVIQNSSMSEGFEYCELDKPLFNEHGQIEETCAFDQFATYIYFTETQTNIDVSGIKGNYIGELEDTLYYLIYKEKNKNDLNKSFLRNLAKGGKKKVIYADRCLIDEDLLIEYNIVFKQIPYEVKVY